MISMFFSLLGGGTEGRDCTAKAKGNSQDWCTKKVSNTKLSRSEHVKTAFEEFIDPQH